MKKLSTEYITIKKKRSKKRSKKTRRESRKPKTDLFENRSVSVSVSVSRRALVHVLTLIEDLMTSCNVISSLLDQIAVTLCDEHTQMKKGGAESVSNAFVF
jgi:hypothetical protein